MSRNWALSRVSDVCGTAWQMLTSDSRNSISSIRDVANDNVIFGRVLLVKDAPVAPSFGAASTLIAQYIVWAEVSHCEVTPEILGLIRWSVFSGFGIRVGVHVFAAQVRAHFCTVVVHV